MVDVEILATPDDVALRTAEIVTGTAQEAISERGRFTLSLTGGPVPQKAYSLLAEPGRAGQIDWARTYIVFGDERVGGPEEEDSNYAGAKKTLLDLVPLPPENIIPAAIRAGTREEQAEAYAQRLAEFFGIPAHGLPPCLDLILLGLGQDGHMNSLFPEADALQIRDRWVASTPPGTLPPPLDRVTLTFPVVNAARQVVLIASGSDRADAVRDILEGGAPLERRPAVGVQPTDGSVTWLLDEEAASLLHNKSAAAYQR